MEKQQLTIEVYGNTKKDALNALAAIYRSLHLSPNDFSSFDNGSGYLFEWTKVTRSDDDEEVIIP